MGAPEAAGAHQNAKLRRYAMRRTEMMRLSAVVALGAILAHTFVFANYTIVHRRTFNLNATFAGAEAIGDVAFDGNYLYVSSWHNAAGTCKPCAWCRWAISGTLLGTPSGALAPSGWTVTVSAAGCFARHAAGVSRQPPLLGIRLGRWYSCNTGIRKYD
jgi:hypothetical protein